MKLEQLLLMAKSQLLVRASLKIRPGRTGKLDATTTIVLCHWDGKNFCEMTYTYNGTPVSPIENCTERTWLSCRQGNSDTPAKYMLAEWKRDGEELWFSERQFVGYLQHFNKLNPIMGCHQLMSCHYLLIPHYARFEIMLEKRAGYPKIIHHRFAAFFQQQIESWHNIARPFQ